MHAVGTGEGAGLGRSVGSKVGPLEGTGEGPSVGSVDGTDEGSSVGPGEGTGLGSGVGLQSIRSCGSKHLSGQQAHSRPVGKGNVLHSSFPIEAQLGGRSSASICQHATGHSSIK